MPLADALAAAAAGEINNAPLLLSLYWLDRNAAPPERAMAAIRRRRRPLPPMTGP